MKNKKHVIVGIALSAALVTGAAAYAINDSAFLKSKEEINQNEEPTVKLHEIRLEANKDKSVDDFKKIEELPGIVPDEKLKNAEYKTKKLMTYKDSRNLGYTDQSIIYEIDPDRMVYVVQVKSHEELKYDEGKFKNPLITTIYDAETGEKISFLWQGEQ